MNSSDRILLHVCCGPCATSSIERLLEDDWKVDLFYSNSNISTYDEYLKRLEGVMKVADYFKIDWFEDEYMHPSWLKAVAGLEAEPERGRRCDRCFGFSLARTAFIAEQGQYKGFTSTLSVSPHKNSARLFEAGKTAGNYIEYDFKKKDGYKRSIELAGELGLYRQNFCGCEFSILNREEL